MKIYREGQWLSKDQTNTVTSTTLMSFSSYYLDTPTPTSAMFFEAAMFNEPQMIKQVIKNSIKEGFKHIDCAKLYSGIPEEQIGQAIKEALQMYNVKREEIYITSSLRDIPSHTIMLEKGQNTVKQEYEELIGNQCTSSLKQLGVEYLDLLLVNYDADDEERFKNIWCAMENLVDQGLVKSIGVNNISVLEIHEMLSWARIRPVCPYPSNTL